MVRPPRAARPHQPTTSWALTRRARPSSNTRGSAAGEHARYGPPPRRERTLALLFRGLFRLRSADRGPHLPLLLGRRQYGGDAQGLQPQLTAPALGMIEVLVLLVLDHPIGARQGGSDQSW